ncbi:MAG: peptidylprolyl isomerase [Christensenellales bacterium]|jgi:peptidyl-prolyl cis-trans isomerase B (cyclophilin B)
MKNKGLIIVLLCVLVAAAIVIAVVLTRKPDKSGEAIPNPIVAMEIEDLGTITLELYPNVCYNTVANFVTLAQSGYYDNLTFHRIIAGFMIQGGDPLGNGTGGPGYSIKGEFSANNVPNDIKHERGVISMARSAANDSAGSQFFIMHAAAPHLDGQYAAFGKVVDDASMAVVDAIANTPTDSGDRPLVERRIKRVTVDTKGVEYTVEKIED